MNPPTNVTILSAVPPLHHRVDMDCDCTSLDYSFEYSNILIKYLIINYYFILFYYSHILLFPHFL